MFFAGILKVNDENSQIQDPDPDPNPDPLVRGMDPRIRIRIHPKMSWIRNSAGKPIIFERSKFKKEWITGLRAYVALSVTTGGTLHLQDKKQQCKQFPTNRDKTMYGGKTIKQCKKINFNTEKQQNK